MLDWIANWDAIGRALCTIIFLVPGALLHTHFKNFDRPDSLSIFHGDWWGLLLYKIRFHYLLYFLTFVFFVVHLSTLKFRTEEEVLALRIERANERYEQEKAEVEEAHRVQLIKAQSEVKLAEIEAKRLALYNDSVKTGEHVQELEKAKAKLKTIKAQGADYSALSKGKDVPSVPISDQTKLILSGLWLGACFFLQRVFEKFFQDKGYALLTVCAAGFLLAFFTANYFLLGGSVTGGIMGSVGDRG